MYLIVVLFTMSFFVLLSKLIRCFFLLLGLLSPREPTNQHGFLDIFSAPMTERGRMRVGQVKLTGL